MHAAESSRDALREAKRLLVDLLTRREATIDEQKTEIEEKAAKIRYLTRYSRLATGVAVVLATGWFCLFVFLICVVARG